MAVAVELRRIDQGGGDFNQLPVARGTEEAVPPAGVAGDAVLVDQQQNGVAVAVEPQFVQRLLLARRLTFAP
jgi:hypothetical protein